MKTKTIVSLYALVIALGAGVLIAKLIQNAEEDSSTEFSRGYKPFEKISPGEISEIHLKGANQSTTIKIADGKWVVAERENYPANASTLQSLIRKINDLTIAQSLEAGESFDPRFGMDEKSGDPLSHGTVITLKKSDGAEITRLKIGKDVPSSSAQDPMAAMMGGGNPASGKYIRLKPDPKSVYVINDPLTEAKSHPKDWLVKDFISVSNITSIALSPAGNMEQVEWKVTRPTTTADFQLEGGIPAGKTANTATLNALKNALSYAKFEDIVSAEAAKGLIGNAKSRRATITTAEGFTYIIDISPKDAAGTENFLMTVKVSANLKTERVKPKEETAEAAKAAEDTFQKALKEWQQKLAKEQALSGKVFEITNYTVQSLLKSKNDLFQDTGAAVSGAPQGLPQGFPQGAGGLPFQLPTQ